MIKKINNNMKIFSFFSGAGFLDLGFELEKFDIVFVNECNEDFLNAYQFARRNMNIKPPRFGYFCDDINCLLKGKGKSWLTEKVTLEKEGGLVGFIGGPPCPDFSVAGKNKGISGENGMLTNSYKRIILQQEPDFFVFENVKGLWSTQKHRIEYEKIKSSFRRKGYILIDKLVNALDYGVPQDRERVILFGIKFNLVDHNRRIALLKLKENFGWGIKQEYCQEHRSQCEWPETNPFVENSIIEQPANIIPELSIEYWFRKNDVYNHYNADDYFQPRSMDRFKNVQEGDVSKKSFKRLHRWRYSATAAYGNNEVHLHPYLVRRISVAEALAIQSLPKEYKINKELSKSDMFKTVGNGVPYLLAKGVAHSIRQFCENELYKGDNDGIYT